MKRYFTKLDLYILKKFLGTFFFSLLLIITIAVIFDVSEKIDDFLEHKAPLSAIILDYYFNFIPYFAILFSSLFVFIAVIFFTSKMAYDTEIIAIFSSGISFHRFLFPYFIGAFIIASLSYYLTNYIIPSATKKRMIFEELYYYSNPVFYNEQNIHKQVNPGTYIYLESFSTLTDIGRRFTIEKFDSGQLLSKFQADYIKWDSTKQKWEARNYYIRNIINGKEEIISGHLIDTTIGIIPDDFKKRDNIIETMSTPELNDFIALQKMYGATSLELLLIEKYKRFSTPFSTFILTLIGVSISSRKIRGGIGMHIGLGLLISFSYILFMQFSSQFAIGGSIPPLIAVWIPNILFAIIGAYLYVKAPK
jgi:lipopolysaccharide export system permease protein